MTDFDAGVLHDEHYEDRQALRTLLRQVADAINGQDWATLTPLLDEHILVTMIDQVTLRGPEALAEYVNSKLGRFSRILADFNVDPVPDAPANFYGDTAICTLSSADQFIFRNGKDFRVQNKYTATLVKKGGAWKLVALHGGANAFNNPISNRVLTRGLAAAGVGGLLLGWLMGRR